MPFVRVSRDKRGYQQVYLMDAPVRRGRPSKPVLLYWYRTPPGVRVGRDPFDPEVRQALQSKNPGVVFDWEKLSVLPVVPAETESWRERRRAERAARQGDTASSDEPAEAEGRPVSSPADVQGVESTDALRRRRRRRGHRPSAGTPEPGQGQAELDEQPEPPEPS